jgi:hypothetical protein
MTTTIGAITASDIDAVITKSLKGRSDGAKANLAALWHLRSMPGYLTIPEAAETSNCSESTIYTAITRIENAIACNRRDVEKARQYRAFSTPKNLSCN